MTKSHGLDRRRLLKILGAGLAVTALPPSLAAASITAPGVVVLPGALDLGVPYGNIGPELIAAGAIEPSAFQDVYRRSGQPLTEHQRRILLEGSDETIVLGQENAYFLLNLLWALGLTNKNHILTHGPMTNGGVERLGGYASTGGWRLGRKSPMELYASTPLIELSAPQQARLSVVADGVYRPCCDNPTSFPDCNHGMAMFALLQLLAARDFDTHRLFVAAMAANQFWYPNETVLVATYIMATQGLTYIQANPRQAMGRQMFSISGYRQVVSWLRDNNMHPAPGGARQDC